MPSGRDRRNYRVPGGTEITNRYQALLDGTLKMEDLTMDELLQGKLMDKGGGFRGRPMRVVPREMHMALVRELIHREEAHLLKSYHTMYETLVEIATNPRINGQARVTAATYVIERISGKIPDQAKVQLEVTKFDNLISSGELVMDIGELQALTKEAHEVVVDAEVVEEPPPTPRPKRRRSPRANQ